MKKLIIIVLYGFVYIFCQAEQGYVTATFKLNTENYYCKVGQSPPIFNADHVVSFILKPGQYTFYFEKHGYRTYFENIHLTESINRKISLNPNINVLFPAPRTGILKIDINPSDALVTLNNKIVDIQNIADLVVGGYKIRFFHNQYQMSEKSIKIIQGDTTYVNLALNPIYSILKINTMPMDSIRVYINDVFTGLTPYINDEMIIGKYTLELRDHSHLPEIRHINIAKERTTELNINLKNIQLYQKEQRNFWKKEKRFWGVVTLYCAGIGYILHQSSEDIYSNYYMKSENVQDINEFRNQIELLDIFTHVASAAAISSASSFIHSLIREKSYPK